LRAGIYVNSIGVTVPQVPEEPCDYDDSQFGGSSNGVIDKAEVIRAILDYFGQPNAMGLRQLIDC